MIIAVDFTEFLERFPEFVDITEEQVNNAYKFVPDFFETTAGAIGLPLPVQTNGVYLATAHSLWISQNPDKIRQLNSASEGDVSAGFNNYQAKNALEYWLSLSPYGLQLLGIIAQIQPPTPRKPINMTYYWSFMSGKN